MKDVFSHFLIIFLSPEKCVRITYIVYIYLPTS